MIELGAQEWRDDFFLRYDLEPLDLPKFCDYFNVSLSIWNALDCKKGGLVTEHHNDIRDVVADLSGKASTPTHVRNNPPHIHRSRRAKAKGSYGRDHTLPINNKK